MGKVISICKNGVRYDMVAKQEPIASDEPVISAGAIVTLNGHKGKVLDVTGDKATVSWEDASMSEVKISDLGYAGRVQSGEVNKGKK